MKKYSVTLTEDERKSLEYLISRGKGLLHARMLALRGLLPRLAVGMSGFRFIPPVYFIIHYFLNGFSGFARAYPIPQLPLFKPSETPQVG